jgi:phosphate transport system substrate-binding protein
LCGDTINLRIIALLAALLIGLSVPVMAVEKVTVSGSSTVLPLAEAGAEEFNLQQGNYRVSITGGGTGAGMTGIAEGRTDIAMASREVTSDEKSKYGDKFQEFLVGYDGIVMVVSPQIYNAGIKDLSKDQIKGIYAGEIKNWNELGGPDDEIYVIAREQGSGTRDTFNEDIMDDKKAETPGVITTALGSAEVKTAVAGSDKAIGYLGYSYSEGGNVRPIALDGILPTAQSIRDGTYELSRKLYFYTYGDPTTGAKAFIDFMIGPEGQMIAEENGFIAVSDVPKMASEIGSEPSAEEEGASGAEQQPGFEIIPTLIGLLAVSYIALGRKS